MKLELRHLWGAPKAWHLDGPDEQELRRMLADLSAHEADPQKRSAVLVAFTDEGAPIGAWSREGAARLASVIKSKGLTPPWADIWSSLEDGVTGP